MLTLKTFRRPIGFIHHPQNAAFIFLPQLFRLSVIGIASLFVVSVGLKLVQDEYHDPFQPYQTIMPGQSAAHLSDFSCQSTENSMSHGYGAVSDTRQCAIFPQSGDFHLVDVETKNGLIHQLTFYADSVRLGDIALHWGRMQRRPRSRDRLIPQIWTRSDYKVEVHIQQLDYQLTVRVVTLSPNQPAH
jgi:hypothetical protein